jgi:dipeptidyl-peptidase 4
MDRPPTVRLCRGDDGTVVKELGQAGKGAATRYRFSEKQRLSIACRDGYRVDASLMLPQDRKGHFPIYVPTYSGPDSASVRDAWGHSTWQQYLCQQGFAVLQVNVRSASNRGQVHTAACYQKLGEQELADLEDAVRFVAGKYDGDLDKVAISGASYGGFMSAYALTHGSVFKLGIASAGVYDWRLYDTVYTERYMRTPQENLQGYDATSVIKSAKDLHGHLVLLHGTMDDNVHEQNVIQLLWALQTAGKTDFELMLYPRSKHGVDPKLRWHAQYMEWNALRRLRDGKLANG